eukprot:COSAG02_NODE_123_length_35269_cov_51.697526_6_plen_300_part_00
MQQPILALALRHTFGASDLSAYLLMRCNRTHRLALRNHVQQGIHRSARMATWLHTTNLSALRYSAGSASFPPPPRNPPHAIVMGRKDWALTLALLLRCRTMEYLASTARKISVRSGGHFAVIGISEAGDASFFCTHQDGQLTKLWQKEEVQSWLQMRHRQPEDPVVQAGDEPAYKTPGLGKLKKFMASHGVITVSDLAWADDAVIAAISLKVKNRDKFQAALSDVRTLIGPRPGGACASGNAAAERVAVSGNAAAERVAVSLTARRNLPVASTGATLVTAELRPLPPGGQEQGDKLPLL